MTIEYECDDFNEITAFFRWRGSALHAVLCRPPFWILVGTHCALLWMRHVLHSHLFGDLSPEYHAGESGHGGWLQHANQTDDATEYAISLLIFYLVYYSGQCYNRFYSMYDTCMKLSGDIQCYVGLCRVYFPAATPDVLWNLSRHMVASVYFFYFELGGLEKQNASGAITGDVTDVEWNVLIRSQLILPEERQVLERYEGSRSFLMQSWALRLACAQIKKPDSYRGADIRELENHVLSLRANCAEISNMLEQPVPFAMYHTLTSSLTLTLFSVAYALVGTDTYMSIPAFSIICFVCLALKETAVYLSDPFGTDPVDFETDVFMARIMLNTKAMVSRDATYKRQHMQMPPITYFGEDLGQPKREIGEMWGLPLAV